MSAPSATLAFVSLSVFAFLALEALEPDGSASSSSSSTAFRLDDAARFGAGRFDAAALVSSTVSLKSSAGGEPSESCSSSAVALRLVDAVRFGGIVVRI